VNNNISSTGRRDRMDSAPALCSSAPDSNPGSVIGCLGCFFFRSFLQFLKAHTGQFLQLGQVSFLPYRRRRRSGGGGFLRMSEGEGAVQENLVQTVQAVFASTVPEFSHLTITCGHNLVNHIDLIMFFSRWYCDCGREHFSTHLGNESIFSLV
jgi:hypothetical protein